jgi:hypothetical protein
MSATPDITTLVNSLGSQNPKDLQSRVGINPYRDDINYRPTPGTREWTIGYQAGKTLPSWAIGKGMLRPLRYGLDSLGTNHLAAGATGAIVGGLAGAGSALVSGGNIGRGTLTGAGTGLAGMLLASMYARNRLANTPAYQLPRPARPWEEKRAFASDPTMVIQQKLMSDGSLSYSDKSIILQQINQLDAGQKSHLADVLRTAMGAGIGVLIARYLLKFGIGGTALLGIIGGAVGSQYFGNRNAYGQRMDTSSDPFGRARYV